MNLRRLTSLIKNRITYWLGDQLGMRYTPQTVPVEVVMEGANSREYLGTYCLSEGPVPIDYLTFP